jgi:hypothetical protein
VVRVPGCRSRGPGSIPMRYQIFSEIVGLELDPLSLVSTRLIHKVRFPGAVYRNKTQLHGNIYCNRYRSVQLFFNIFATGIETFVIPWDQLLYTVS